MIIITRSKDRADARRVYKVFLDGALVGKIKRGEKAKFGLTPGAHKLHVEVDWCRSQTIEFEYADKHLKFECGSNLIGWKRWFPLLVILFDSKNYLWLKQANDAASVLAASNEQARNGEQLGANN